MGGFFPCDKLRGRMTILKEGCAQNDKSIHSYERNAGILRCAQNDKA